MLARLSQAFEQAGLCAVLQERRRPWLPQALPWPGLPVAAVLLFPDSCLHMYAVSKPVAWVELAGQPPVPHKVPFASSLPCAGSCVKLVSPLAMQLRGFPSGSNWYISPFRAGLASTVNLGMSDVYPAGSGKQGAAIQIAKHFNADLCDCAFLCDDDNDIQLAKVVGKAYLPSVAAVRSLNP